MLYPLPGSVFGVIGKFGSARKDDSSFKEAARTDIGSGIKRLPIQAATGAKQFFDLGVDRELLCNGSHVLSLGLGQRRFAACLIVDRD